MKRHFSLATARAFAHIQLFGPAKRFGGQIVGELWRSALIRTWQFAFCFAVSFCTVAQPAMFTTVSKPEPPIKGPPNPPKPGAQAQIEAVSVSKPAVLVGDRFVVIVVVKNVGAEGGLFEARIEGAFQSGIIAPGERQKFSFEMTATAGGVKSLSVQARAADPAESGWAEASATIIVNQTPPSSPAKPQVNIVRMTGSKTSVQLGEVFTVTVTAKNVGGAGRIELKLKESLRADWAVLTPQFSRMLELGETRDFNFEVKAITAGLHLLCAEWRLVAPERAEWQQECDFKVLASAFSIDVSSGPGGTVSPSARTYVNQGGSLTLSASPEAGAVVDAWYVDGKLEQSGGETFTLSNLQANHSVQARFRKVATVVFNNFVVTAINAPITLSDGRKLADGWTAQLYGGPPESPVERLQPLFPATTFKSDAAGYLNSVNVSVEGLPVDGRVKLVMRVFDGATYETSKQRGQSVPITITLRETPDAFNFLLGLKSFAVRDASNPGIPPTLLVKPASKSVTEGDNVLFEVVASGTSPLVYQWKFNGRPIDGAILQTWRINRIGFDQAGSYSVVVSNPLGSVESEPVQLTVLPKPWIGVANDLDGDGLPDLIFQSDDGFLGAWLMDGTRLHSSRFLEPKLLLDPQYRIVGSGDFNGDQRTDLLFQHADGTLAVWEMNGTELEQAALLQPHHPGDRQWRVVGVGDVDGDGKPDLFFQHADSSLAVWRMNGLVMQAASLLFPPQPLNADERVVGVGDLDGNRFPDLLFQNSDGKLRLWKFYLPGAPLAPLSPAWPEDFQARVVSVTDSNQDGRDDLVLRGSGGSLSVWFMDGPDRTAVQALDPSQAGGTWKIVAP